MFISSLCTKCLETKIEVYDLGSLGRTNKRMYSSCTRVVTALQDGTELVCDGLLSFSDSWWPVDCKHLYRGRAASPKHGKYDLMVKPDKQTCGSSLFGYIYGGEKKFWLYQPLSEWTLETGESTHYTQDVYLHEPTTTQRHNFRGSLGSGWNLSHGGLKEGDGGKLIIYFHRCLITASLGSAPH